MPKRNTYYCNYVSHAVFLNLPNTRNTVAYFFGRANCAEVLTKFVARSSLRGRGAAAGVHLKCFSRHWRFSTSEKFLTGHKLASRVGQAGQAGQAGQSTGSSNSPAFSVCTGGRLLWGVVSWDTVVCMECAQSAQPRQTPTHTHKYILLGVCLRRGCCLYSTPKRNERQPKQKPLHKHRCEAPTTTTTKTAISKTTSN